MQKKSILLINGSQVLMDITKKILERSGFVVRCSVGAAGAHEQLMDYNPDLIVLGNDLPDMGGLELCSKLHEKHDIPILYTSDVKEDELPALKLGASDFLKKPFDYEIFKARISVLLNARNKTSPEDSNDKSDDSKESSEDDNGGSEEPKHAARRARRPLETRIRGPKAQRAFMFIAAAIMIAALVMIGIFISLRPDLNLTDIPDGDIPLTGFPIETQGG